MLIPPPGPVAWAHRRAGRPDGERLKLRGDLRVGDLFFIPFGLIGRLQLDEFLHPGHPEWAGGPARPGRGRKGPAAAEQVQGVAGVGIPGDQSKGPLGGIDGPVHLAGLLEDGGDGQVFARRVAGPADAFVGEGQPRTSGEVAGREASNVVPILQRLLGVPAADVQLGGGLVLLDRFLHLTQALEDLGALLHRQGSLGGLCRTMIRRQRLLELAGLQQSQPEAGERGGVFWEFGECLAVELDRLIPLKIPRG
jgi:hypothetical protein